MRLTVELEVPDDQADEELWANLRQLAKSWLGWKLMSVQKSTDPPCPQCGLPMEWDRDFAGYVCHHPA